MLSSPHPLQPPIDGETRQNQDHGIDAPPHKRDPRAHLIVAALIDTAQQPADNGACNQALEGADGGKRRRHSPDELPVSPLDDAGPQGDDQVDAADEQQGPVDGEAQDVRGAVEVEGLRGAGGEGPVERGEGGGCVAEGGGAVEALDEAVGVGLVGRRGGSGWSGEEGKDECTSSVRHGWSALESVAVGAQRWLLRVCCLL